MTTLYKRWSVRHVTRLNLALHAVGIPLTIAAVPVLIFYSATAALTLFIAGYAMQFAGHAIEGNKAGEQMLIEKWLGRFRINNK